MLLWLAQLLQDDFGFLRVINYITLRAVMATLTAGLIGLFFGPWVIRRLTAMKVGQSSFNSDESRSGSSHRWTANSFG